MASRPHPLRPHPTLHRSRRAPGQLSSTAFDSRARARLPRPRPPARHPARVRVRGPGSPATALCRAPRPRTDPAHVTSRWDRQSDGLQPFFFRYIHGSVTHIYCFVTPPPPWGLRSRSNASPDRSQRPKRDGPAVQARETVNPRP
ncbi:hypothetical protein A0H81_08472 [Grifola frondosa]|uniref:Uncharacterized protein n=1 Tax=Grifola frondosa TaxID=5627 RepID=A0A1C7M2G3_GRIFR|nr:hypothetical protein A0H81_08472 [Grifola frondosa]